jgi:hypothetical protein
MKKIISLFLITLILSSCNPRLHIIGSGMRHHNLSQNKYQPGKHRKKINVGSNQHSPIWLILRKH